MIVDPFEQNSLGSSEAGQSAGAFKSGINGRLTVQFIDPGFIHASGDGDLRPDWGNVDHIPWQ